MIVKRCQKAISVMIVATSIFYLSACRYKENDRIALQSTYKRLCKTWQLKSAVVESTGIEKLDSITVLRDRKLTIERGIDKDKIMLNSDPEPFVTCALDQNKTRIYTYNMESEGTLKIIRLTNGELWLKGQPIAMVLGGGGEPDDIITFKYRALND